MVLANHKLKTIWEKIYSLLGFWTYLVHDPNDESKCRRFLYWMMLPWGPYYRKFDVLSWDVSATESIAVRRKNMLSRQEFKCWY